jgi:hypothetical protein
MKTKKETIARSAGPGYNAVLVDVVHVVEAARSAAARGERGQDGHLLGDRA